MKIETKFSLGDYVISSQELNATPVIGIVEKVQVIVGKDGPAIKYDVCGNDRCYTCPENLLSLVTVLSRAVVL